MLLVALALGFPACKKTNEILLNSGETLEYSQDNMYSNITTGQVCCLDSLDFLMNPINTSRGYTEYEVYPKFGKPNVTNYVFRVFDVNGNHALSVKIYDKATDQIVGYYPMSRTGPHWYLIMTIPISSSDLSGNISTQNDEIIRLEFPYGEIKDKMLSINMQ